MLEMKETAFICNNADSGSLVLLDELGRATSNEDGIAIAWAVSEYLIAKKAMTFFVSHYPQICRLEKIYPVVQNHHLAASVLPDSSNSITYTHKIVAGPCSVSAEYGVEMANSCGWPADVVAEVSRHNGALLLRPEPHPSRFCNRPEKSNALFEERYQRTCVLKLKAEEMEDTNLRSNSKNCL